MNDEPPDSGPVPHRSMWQRRRRSIMITGWIIVGVAALIGGYCFYAFKNA
jgi:hypothetical protein